MEPSVKASIWFIQGSGVFWWKNHIRIQKPWVFNLLGLGQHPSPLPPPPLDPFAVKQGGEGAEPMCLPRIAGVSWALRPIIPTAELHAGGCSPTWDSIMVTTLFLGKAQLRGSLATLACALRPRHRNLQPLQNSRN